MVPQSSSMIKWKWLIKDHCKGDAREWARSLLSLEQTLELHEELLDSIIICTVTNKWGSIDKRFPGLGKEVPRWVEQTLLESCLTPRSKKIKQISPQGWGAAFLAIMEESIDNKKPYIYIFYWLLHGQWPMACPCGQAERLQKPHLLRGEIRAQHHGNLRCTWGQVNGYYNSFPGWESEWN